jgi:hypothetical protein
VFGRGIKKLVAAEGNLLLEDRPHRLYRRPGRCSRIRAGIPPSARKQMLWWIISAARDTTRAGRITHVVTEAANGQRARG